MLKAVLVVLGWNGYGSTRPVYILTEVIDVSKVQLERKQLLYCIVVGTELIGQLRQAALCRHDLVI